MKENTNTNVQLENGSPAFAKPGLCAVPSNRVYLEDCTEALKRFRNGDIIGNKEIADFFKVTNQGGIRKSLKTKSIVVIAKFTDCSYKHSKKEDILYFVGMGKKGNQQLTRQNKALFDAKKEGFAIHVFEMYEEGNYTYKGIHEISGDLLNEKQLDDNGEERDVIIFPLEKI